MSSMSRWSSVARIVGAAAIALSLGLAVQPAQADRGWKHGHKWHQRYDNGPRVVLGYNSRPYYRPYYAPPPAYYAPAPGYYYAPPPTYYAPRPRPSVNLQFRF